jgi:hypothetical protein
MAVDFDRLVDRYSIAADVLAVAERQQDQALRDAAYLAKPRVVLGDQQRRLVRVLNAPEEARRDPPPLLSHWWTDTLTRGQVETVGRHRPNPDNPRDLDYQLSATRAGVVVGALCPDCQTPEENAEAEINAATLEYQPDPHGRMTARPKSDG